LQNFLSVDILLKTVVNYNQVTGSKEAKSQPCEGIRKS